MTRGIGGREMNPLNVDTENSVTRQSRGLRLMHVQHYALAVLSVSVALGASLLLQHFHFRVPAVPLLLFAVAISVWYGGTGPAVLAAALSIVGFYWYFVEPVRTIYIYLSEIPFFIVFVAFVALLSWFGVIRRRVEKDLRDQADLLNLTHDTIFVMGMEGVIKYWNRGAEERYGYTAQQAEGKGVHDLLKTVFPAPLEAIKAEVTRTGRWEGELLHTKRDGTLVTLASRWALQRDDRGAPLAILETNNDITERKRAEQDLRRLNRELKVISDCNQTLLRATDEQSLLDQICRIVCEQAGYRMAFVAYAEHDEAKSARPVAWTGAEEGYLKTADLTWTDTERGCGPTGTAIRSAESCCIQDLAMDPRAGPWAEGLLQRGSRSAIAFPLKDEHGRVFAALTICSAEVNSFTSAEIALLEELAGDLAYGITAFLTRAERQRADEALRINEARYRTAEAVGHVGNWEYDVRTNTYWGSDEAKRMFGFDPGQTDFTIDEVENCIPERDRVHQALVDLIEAGKPYNLEFEMRPRSSTEVRIISSVAQLLRDEQGNALKVVGSIRDITESKHAHHRIALLNSAMNKVHDAAFLSDAKARFHYVNEAACRALGYTGAELLGMTVPDIDLQIPAERWPERWLELEAQRTLTFESFHRTRDGRIFPVEIRGNYFEYGGGAYCLALVTDITERKRAEEALRLANAYNRGLIEASLDPLVAIRPDGKITDVNAATEVATGRSRGELIGTDFCGYFTEPANARAGYEQVFREGLVRDYPLELRHRDGRVMSVSYNAAVYRDESGEVVGVFAAARDSTERLQAEEQRERMRQLEAELAHLDRLSLLGELAASIAHEVNQPLSGVVSNGSACLRWLAGDSPNVEEARESARRIVRDGKRAAEVITRIRALTKKTAAVREELDLNQTIREVFALVGDESKKNHIRIQMKFADDIPPVLGDRVQLQQVVLNLVMNAIDAMRSIDRPRELVVSTRNVDPHQVQVTVEDSGIGLDPSMIGKIFDPFYTTKPGGMGMGLSVSRSIVDVHGGLLWATAKEGGPGSMFHFTLPVKREEGSNGRA